MIISMFSNREIQFFSVTQLEIIYHLINVSKINLVGALSPKIIIPKKGKNNVERRGGQQGMGIQN